MNDEDRAKALFFEALDRLDAREFAAAEEKLRAVLALAPERVSVLVNLAAAQYHQFRTAEAAELAERALALAPDDVEALVLLGLCRTRQRARDAAVSCFDRALALAPGHPEALLGRAHALGRPDLVAEAQEAAFARDPDAPEVLGALIGARMQACDWSGIEALWAQAIAGIRAGKPVAEPFLVASVPGVTPADQLAVARAFVARNYPAEAPRWFAAPASGQRIRLAYLSADFRNHATSMLAAGMFEAHDRARFETIAISYGFDDGSALRARTEAAFDRFIDVRDRSDRDIADLIRELSVDIAVDLGGFTTNNRTGALASRPAPVQIGFLGFPATTGMAAVDYIVADATVVPPGAERFYQEAVIRMPDCYQVNDDKRPIDPATPTRHEAGLPDKGFVFCAFGNSFKITPAVFDIWMRLLRAVEGSVLWLIGGSAVAEENLRREASARGVAPERLVFAPRTDNAQHLARQRLADLFVDTFPYNGHTTASDALYAGLPVVTTLGDTFASRVAASLLRAVGLPELIAETPEGYEKLALRLARDPEALAAVRAKLAAKLESAPLFDTARFTRNLEAAYAEALARSRAGKPPAAIDVRALASSGQ